MASNYQKAVFTASELTSYDIGFTQNLGKSGKIWEIFIPKKSELKGVAVRCSDDNLLFLLVRTARLELARLSASEPKSGNTCALSHCCV